ncbi:MAG: SAM-dependent chlorinase/fluorinase [Candidatus Omnitrophota bacterium]
MAIIALLTDFGYRDEYVGVVKGVISKINSVKRNQLRFKLLVYFDI